LETSVISGWSRSRDDLTSQPKQNIQTEKCDVWTPVSMAICGQLPQVRKPEIVVLRYLSVDFQSSGLENDSSLNCLWLIGWIEVDWKRGKQLTISLWVGAVSVEGDGEWK
jgi:hypothetical protein